MNKDRKLVFGILMLLVGIVAISLSYAVFTQNLNINGTANVTASSWSVHFANLVQDVIANTAQEVTAPVIKASRTDIGDYSVKFFTPGDFITYTFDVVNDGDYDAKISVLTKGTPTCSGNDSTSNTNVCNHIGYNLYYTSNDREVAANDTLRKGQTKNITLEVFYDPFIDASELPTSEVTVSNLGISIQYVQDSNAEGNPPTYVYTASATGFYLGDEIPEGAITYNNYASTGKNVFLRHTIEDGVIIDSYVGFIKDGEVYYLGGGGSSAYSLNQAVLIDAFGTNNCDLTHALGNFNDKRILSWIGIPIVEASGLSQQVSCSELSLTAYVTYEGTVVAIDDKWECQAGGWRSQCIAR